MPTRKANATWEGGLKGGKGDFKGESGLIAGSFNFGTRFGEQAGTNPEELLAAAQAACFSMALAAGLEGAGTPARPLSRRGRSGHPTLQRDGSESAAGHDAQRRLRPWLKAGGSWSTPAVRPFEGEPHGHLQPPSATLQDCCARTGRRPSTQLPRGRSGPAGHRRGSEEDDRQLSDNRCSSRAPHGALHGSRHRQYFQRCCR